MYSAAVDLAASPLELVIRLGLAAIAGMAVGWEREARQRPAGLRTHMLVAVGACAFVLIALELSERQSEVDGGRAWDVLRVVSGVIAGIGFLGAGVIIHSEGQVRGLTTAAGIWVVAAPGAAAAAGSLWILGTALGLAIVILAALRALEHRIFDHEDPD